MTEQLTGFEPQEHEILENLRRIYFWIHLAADFSAGLCFVVGSILFFYPALVHAGTWLFLVGSIMFAAKPTVRLAHEIHRARTAARLH